MAEVRWIKVQTDLFSSRKIKILTSLDNGYLYIIIWLQLLCLAGEINDGGYIYITKDVGYTDDMLSVHFGMPVEVITAALKIFKEFRMVDDEDGIVRISNWDRYQSVDRMQEIREYNRISQQRSRAKKKTESNVIDMSMTSQDDKSMTSQHRVEQIRADKKRVDSSNATESLYEKACREFGKEAVDSRMKRYPRARMETIYSWLRENRQVWKPTMTHEYDFTKLESEVLADEA